MQKQASEELDPALEYELLAQDWHELSVVAPSSLPNLPSAHSVHGEDPFAGLYLPAAHSKHSFPPTPVYPELQMQSSSSLLPAKELVFGGHARHSDKYSAAMVSEYFPAGHKAQEADPFIDLKVPALQA